MTTEQTQNLSDVEGIKASSNYLRGTIAEGLLDPITGALSESDTNLTKFHGIYQQDDRDLRNERRHQKLEPAYIFMIRVRVPGGVCTPQQWLALDALAQTHANGTLRLTNRQAFQFHGVVKRKLKETMRGINQTLLDTIAACGDVCRNVMCNPNPYQSRVHAEVYEVAKNISAHLTPRTTAYHEIWLNDTLVAGSQQDEEPIYGKTYLPRKFKVGIALPPSNDIDVYSQDLGFIAIYSGEQLTGFNVAVGGGLGMTFGMPETYPRLADVIGFCTPDQVLTVAENVLKVQRDYGDRTNRKHARLKYTIDDRGIDWFRNELNSRLGWALAPAQPFTFADNGDRYGWIRGTDGNWHLTVFIQSGRVADRDGYPLMTGLREIAKIHKGDFRLTPNQNLIIANVAPKNKKKIDELLRQYKLHDTDQQTALRLNSMACVALPTCGLAFAESERYLPTLLDRLDVVMKEAGLANDPIVIRMTGCPNGCGRPYIGEIGFVGKAVGIYNIYLGAGFPGDRLNKLYRESVREEHIVDEVGPIIHRYAKERNAGERFGDFVIRAGYVREVKAGKDFHA